MKRKVVKHGPATYIVSLPSLWIKKYGIHKGDEVEVDEEGNSIIISPQVTRENKRIEEDVSGLAPRLVDRFLARSYQKGYDEIYLIHNDLNLLETIQKKVPELMGYEIIERDENTCFIKSISNKLEIDFDNSLRRAFLIVKQMLETCIEAYAKDNITTLNNLYLKDLEVNRACYYCLRQINKKQYVPASSAQQTHILYYLIEILEDLGDDVKKLAKELTAVQNNKKEISELLKLILEQYNLSYSYFYEATKEKANNAFDLYNRLNEKINDISQKKIKKGEILALITLSDMKNIVYHFTTMRLDYLSSTKTQQN